MIIFRRVGAYNPYEKQVETDGEVDNIDQAKSAVEEFKGKEAYDEGEEFAVLSSGGDRIFTFRIALKLDIT